MEKINRNSYIFTLIAIVLLFSIFSSPLYMPLPDRDSGVFLYIGKQILAGEKPYLDIWDHKGPALYLINVIGVLIDPDTQWGVWLIETVLILIAALISFFLCREVFNKKVAFLSTIFWLAFFTLIRKPNLSENYYLFVQVLILFMLLIAEKKRASKLEYYVIGLLSAFGFLLRPNLIGLPLAVGVIWLVHLINGKNWKFISFPESLPAGFYLAE